MWVWVWVPFSCHIEDNDRLRKAPSDQPINQNKLTLSLPHTQRDKRTIAHKLHGKREYVVFCKLTDIQVIP